MKKIAAIQMCSSGVVEENLATASGLIARAASDGAKLVVLPEMFPMMGRQATDKVTIKEEDGHGKIQSFLSEQSAQYAVWVVGGTIPLACDDPHKIKASCLVYNHQGKQVARYDKMHLFDAVISESESYKESDTTEPGRELVVVDTPVGRLGLSVCYDIRFPGLFTRLSKLGAEIIALPAAFTMKTGAAHWQLLARSRAVDSFCYVVGACQGGKHASGRQTYGHSLIIDPWGCIVQEVTAPSPAVIDAPIDLEYLHRIRGSFPVIAHQKLTPEICNTNINGR